MNSEHLLYIYYKTISVVSKWGKGKKQLFSVQCSDSSPGGEVVCVVVCSSEYKKDHIKYILYFIPLLLRG